MNRFRKSLAAPLLALALTASAHAAVFPAKSIDQIVTSFHAKDQFSGSILIARHGEVVYQNAIGFANEQFQVPNRIDTKFQIGSLTKQFTAALLIDLQHQGKLDFDAPLARYLPDYRADAASKITLRQLLSHSAGVPDFVRRKDVMDLILHPATPSEIVSNYCSEPLEFEPGSQFKYSNCGYLILGAMYERVSGKSYAEGLAQLLARAGLHDTGYAGPRDIVPRLAVGYVKEKGVAQTAPYIDWSVAFASGSLYSTVPDLWRWYQALTDGRVLGKNASSELFQPGQFGYAYGWHIGRSGVEGMKEFLDHDFGPGSASPGSIHIISHGGDLPGSHSRMTILPEGDYVIILLDNHDSLELSQMTVDIIKALGLVGR